MCKVFEGFAASKASHARSPRSRYSLIVRFSVASKLFLPLLLTLLFSRVAAAQTGGGHTLFGDLKVDQSKVSGLKPMNFEVVLRSESGSILGRQTVANNGRYRFENLSNGIYYIVVSLENSEITSIRMILSGAVSTDFRKDISLEWRPSPSGRKEEKAGVVSAANHYTRSAPNDALFDKAEEAIKRKENDRAKSLLRQVVSADPKDFEAWTELGTVYFRDKNYAEAEKAYFQALEAQPSFILALLNIGKLRLVKKEFQGAVEVLSRAVELKPPSADANYFLGEAYLNLKKGSKAVAYMTEAIRIDPVGMANVHLRLAEIYDSVGLKDLAANEYEQFLIKKPDYPDKKKLQKYISENKKK